MVSFESFSKNSVYCEMLSKSNLARQKYEAFSRFITFPFIFLTASYFFDDLLVAIALVILYLYMTRWLKLRNLCKIAALEVQYGKLILTGQTTKAEAIAKEINNRSYRSL